MAGCDSPIFTFAFCHRLDLGEQVAEIPVVHFHSVIELEGVLVESANRLVDRQT